MFTTSFARQMDLFGYNTSTSHQAVHQPVTPKTGVATRSFETTAPRTASNANKDGQLGGFILDAFFNAAFPGFGAVFGAIGLLDMADVIDETRAAFSRATAPGQPTPAYATARGMIRPASTTIMHHRKPGLLSFMFG
jgi:hypothetical protein